MQDKPGKPLSKFIQGMTPQERADAEGQVAVIFARLQSAPLPESIDTYGGITIANIDTAGDLATEEAGDIVGGKMDEMMCKPGPWKTYGDYWKARLELELEKAGESLVKG